MNLVLNIEVDKNSLITKLLLNQSDEKIINELKIIFSNLSENFNYKDKVFTIPWFELRRGLENLARIFKKEGIIVEYDDFTEKLLKEIVTDRKSIKEKSSLIEIDESELEEILKEYCFLRKLTNEQKRDTIKLLQMKHGANFSVPGAGKTTTLLAVHIILRKFKIVSHLFVISPINAFISWEDEIREIFNENPLKIQRLQRSHLENFSILDEKNLDVVLANYEKLRKDIRQLVPFFINNNIHLILDESHRIKGGMNNISYTQIIKLADIAKRRDILSGTPMPQNYIDLESQFDFLWPGCNIIQDKVIQKDDELTISSINKVIKNLFVRTTKNELGLSDPKIEYNFINMGKIQTELYRLFKSETARIISGMDKPNIYNFRRIGKSVVKLIQAATNPILLTSKDDYGDEIISIPKSKAFWELLEDFQKYEKPVKIEYLKERVNTVISENYKSKIIIWSYFIRNILILEKLFIDLNPVTIYGNVPTGSDEDEKTREHKIRKFHEDNTCRVMIANPQACGEGISLHKVCHYAIYLDRNFNAAYFLQSIDRIHRLGLEKGIKTRIEILIAKNSIDEILIARLNDKINVMGNVLEDPYLHSLAYDPEDISSEEENSIDIYDFKAIQKHVITKWKKK